MEAFQVVGAAVYDASTDELQPASVALMERTENGLSVALLYDRVTRVLTLTVAQCGEHEQAVTVPAERAMEAFLHPSLYVGGICGCLRCKTLDAVTS